LAQQIRYVDFVNAEYIKVRRAWQEAHGVFVVMAAFRDVRTDFTTPDVASEIQTLRAAIARDDKLKWFGQSMYGGPAKRLLNTDGTTLEQFIQAVTDGLAAWEEKYASDEAYMDEADKAGMMGMKQTLETVLAMAVQVRDKRTNVAPEIKASDTETAGTIKVDRNNWDPMDTLTLLALPEGRVPDDALGRANAALACCEALTRRVRALENQVYDLKKQNE